MAGKIIFGDVNEQVNDCDKHSFFQKVETSLTRKRKGLKKQLHCHTFV